MTNDQLEFYLDRKNSFGCNTENSNEVVGWVLLRKRFPIANYFERFDEAFDPERYRAQMQIKHEPYVVGITQVTREVFESDKGPDNDDYLLNEHYTFSTLEDAGSFLKGLGYNLSELKWRVEFDSL
jgi:hypothetical protein